MCTDIGFNLKPARALYLLLQWSYIHSLEGQKWSMNQLEVRSGTTDRAEIFTRSVSHKDHSSLKISAQTVHPKWEIVSEGGFPLNRFTEINWYFFFWLFIFLLRITVNCGVTYTSLNAYVNHCSTNTSPSLPYFTYFDIKSTTISRKIVNNFTSNTFSLFSF